MIDAQAFDMDTIMREASARSDGLSDFGDAHFRPALWIMLQSLEKEARLSSTGRHLIRQRLVELLSNRLKVEDYCKRYPEILEEAIAEPVVIVGLPRTGTTLLQRILATDPRFYSLAWWESRHPVPVSPIEAGKVDPRIESARAEVASMIEAMPELLSIHPLDAEEADEEVMLMEQSFHGAMDAYVHIPAYAAWREQQDQVPAYAYLKKLLQFLQWQKKRRGVLAERWVLKTPHHLYAMKALLTVFPDAKVIQTHRDPLQTVPSLASFVHTLWRIYSDHAEARDAGLQWNGQFARGLRRTMALRDGLDRDVFHDVRFADTVNRPMEVVHDIYRFLKMPLSAGVKVGMQRWLAKNGREKRAPHDYTAARYGLSDEQLRRDYAEYRARYL